VWEQVKALDIKGVYQQREYKRKYPEGEAAAHVVGFTNVERPGQEGIELRFDDALRGPTARAPWCATAWAAWSRTSATGRPGERPRHPAVIDSKVQFFAYQRVRDAVAEHNAKAGSVVVLDVQTGEVLALANYPSYNPGGARAWPARSCATAR
jgi:cell division protein FtsI (penicillin-binding protein 3)